MSEPIHEVRLRVIQQVTLRIPRSDKSAAIELARDAIGTQSYQVQREEIPIIDQYIEGIFVMSIEEKEY